MSVFFSARSPACLSICFHFCLPALESGGGFEVVAVVSVRRRTFVRIVD